MLIFIKGLLIKETVLLTLVVVRPCITWTLVNETVETVKLYGLLLVLH